MVASVPSLSNSMSKKAIFLSFSYSMMNWMAGFWEFMHVSQEFAQPDVMWPDGKDIVHMPCPEGGPPRGGF